MVGWYYLLKFLEVSFVIYYVANFMKKDKMIGFLFAVSISLESLLAFSQFLLHHSIGGIMYFFGERSFSSLTPGIANASINGQLVLRPYGTFSHPNVLAGFLLIGIIIAWHFLKNEKGFIKYFLLVSTSLGVVGILISLSRTTIFLGIGILMIVLLRRLSKKWLLALLLFLSFVLILFPTLFYRFMPSTFEESAVERIQLFSAAWKMIFESPFFGVGLGNFIPSLPSSSLLQPVHNIFALWTVETGIIGGTIMVWFVFGLIKKLFNLWKRSSIKIRQSLTLSILLGVSVVVLGMFDHYFLTLEQGQLLLGVVVGLLW
ncbi:MAG TPA: O-antigen ligase family protein [Patescibacteria group bacterium]